MLFTVGFGTGPHVTTLYDSLFTENWLVTCTTTLCIPFINNTAITYVQVTHLHQHTTLMQSQMLVIYLLLVTMWMDLFLKAWKTRHEWFLNPDEMQTPPSISTSQMISASENFSILMYINAWLVLCVMYLLCRCSNKLFCTTSHILACEDLRMPLILNYDTITSKQRTCLPVKCSN